MSVETSCGDAHDVGNDAAALADMPRMAGTQTGIFNVSVNSARWLMAGMAAAANNNEKARQTAFNAIVDGSVAISRGGMDDMFARRWVVSLSRHGRQGKPGNNMASMVGRLVVSASAWAC